MAAREILLYLEPGYAAQIEAMAIPTASGPIRTTVSAGIAYSTGTESIRSLLMRADEALYEAKSAGRNRVQTHDLRHLAA